MMTADTCNASIAALCRAHGWSSTDWLRVLWGMGYLSSDEVRRIRAWERYRTDGPYPWDVERWGDLVAWYATEEGRVEGDERLAMMDGG